MTENVTNELLYEVLRRVQSDVTEIKSEIRDLRESQISIREELQAIRRDALRQERTIASVHVDLDRVKTPLDLVGPAH